MIRGLLIRRVFVWADCLLVAAIVFVIVVGVTDAFSGDDNKATAVDVSEETRADENMFASVGPRASYDVIISSGIYGPAASRSRDDSGPPPPPPELVEEETETELPLKLWGTVFSVEGDPAASAVIETREGGMRVKTYYVGQEVVRDVLLKEVRRKEVLLDNQRANRIEHLQITGRDDRERGLAKSRTERRTTRSRTNRASTAQVIVLNRREIVKDLVEDYADFAAKIDVKVVKDDQGNVQGITATNLDDIELAQKFGLKDGDVLTTINNEPIDSVDKVYDVIQKYRNASTFRIGIIRNGKPSYLTYRFR